MIKMTEKEQKGIGAMSEYRGQFEQGVDIMQAKYRELVTRVPLSDLEEKVAEKLPIDKYSDIKRLQIRDYDCAELYELYALDIYYTPKHQQDMLVHDLAFILIQKKDSGKAYTVIGEEFDRIDMRIKQDSVKYFFERIMKSKVPPIEECLTSICTATKILYEVNNNLISNHKCKLRDCQTTCTCSR